MTQTGYTHIATAKGHEIYRRTGRLDRNTPRFFVQNLVPGQIVFESGKYAPCARWIRKQARKPFNT